MHWSRCRAHGGAQGWPRDGEDAGLAGVGGLGTGGRGEQIQDFLQSHRPPAQDEGSERRGVLLPVPSPLPAAAGVLLLSLLPAAALKRFVLITGAKENSSVGKRSKRSSAARLAGQGPALPPAPGQGAALPWEVPGSHPGYAGVSRCWAATSASAALRLSEIPVRLCAPPGARLLRSYGSCTSGGCLGAELRPAPALRSSLLPSLRQSGFFSGLPGLCVPVHVGDE